MNNDTEKAIKILKDNKIDEYCQWLLSGNENLYNALRSVQGVEMLTGMYDVTRCYFDYDGTPYKINLIHSDIGFEKYGGDLVVRISIGGNRVLEVGVHTENPVCINLDKLHSVKFIDDWVENISKIVQEAQQIEERQQQEQQEKEAEKIRKQKEQEQAREQEAISKRIDLGKYK